MITLRRSLAAIVLLLLAVGGLWWALRPAAEAPAVAAVADPPAAPERKRPRVRVGRPAPAEAPPAVPTEDPEAKELAYADLSAADKYGLSSGTTGLSQAMTHGCLAHAVARTGRTEPLIVELEASVTAEGLHELVVLYDEEIDAEAVDCLEEVAWQVHWPPLSQPGVFTKRETFVMEAEVKALPLDQALKQANDVLDIAMSPEVMDVVLREE